MTTKVLIVNFGPDPIMVRTVIYDEGQPHRVLETLLVDVQRSNEFFVHTHQQLLIGEKEGKPA